ncbi:FAD-dependent oxidoreductase [Paenibacillus cymbidii]|uniref:FAD-dependent oxidoreductase n=1 Tax=Paenibacillus cymbidii TaxID=1639034 RepID=UPI00108032CE|nr:FAD-dependent oxidoreductase [Paenibacillus cymbidii]
MQHEVKSDITILGGGVGGCAAALAACRQGCRVVMTEETDWIGGQLTSQAVPPDEHPWIEQFGCTASYRQFRNGVRDYYRRHFPLTAEARANVRLNPGNGVVSRLCHEPRVALAVLQQMLAPYIHSGRLTILYETKAVHVETERDSIQAVTVLHTGTGKRTVLHANYFLDATECGDILALGGVEYVTGSESQAQTGEPHALPGAADPMDMQPITACFAIEYEEGADHTIDKPDQYDFWRDYANTDFWSGKLLSWTNPHHITLKPITFPFFPVEGGPVSRWTYRRIIDKSNFAAGTYASDIVTVNWPQNDYWLGSIIDVGEEERLRHLTGAKQLSLSLLYWMQTEAPRPDGKLGYPGIRLSKATVGTEDGLAKYPYVRESRRIQAAFTVLEQHISTEVRGEAGAQPFADSVGIGAYRIDLHPTLGQRPYLDLSCYPFQIPLGCLIPVRVRNLLPACKNIGVTHITNGCFRLHPVEWNIGEAAGALAAYCLQHGDEPARVRNSPERLADFQRRLTLEGVELQWPRVSAL